MTLLLLIGVGDYFLFLYFSLFQIYTIKLNLIEKSIKT